MQSIELSLDTLLLDPNNYRLQDSDGFVEFKPERFHLDKVQKSTLDRLKKRDIKALRNSIVSNGFLQIERIVVGRHELQEEKYLVVEGNRRVAALLLIREQIQAGVDIPDHVEKVLDGVPCLLIEDAGQQAYYRQTLMGIRHVGGIQEWGGYQRAKLIADMRDEHEIELPEIGDRLGLSTHEVTRRYRAYRALDQMRESDEFAEHATADKYPLFHEAVSLPHVRDWLGWNKKSFEFTELAQLDHFYQLITPRRDGETEQPPKLTTYTAVRSLREIVPNEDAKAELLNLDNDLAEALAIVNQVNQSKQWRKEVSRAKSAIEAISYIEVTSFTEEEYGLLDDLVAATNNLLEARPTEASV